MGGTNGTVFINGGTSPDYDTAVAALTGRPAPKRDWTDVASAWVIDVIGGRAGDGLDRFLDNTDAFAAGVSSTVTGGLSDKVRAGIYGDITDQSDNGWYTAGQVVGIAPAFATGLATGGTGALAIASKAFATLDTAHGFYESGSKFANGEPLHWTDYASFLPLGGALTSKFASRFKGAVASTHRTELTLPILDRSFVPRAPLDDLIIHQASLRGFNTSQSEAILWSGLGNGVFRSSKYAIENGGRTLEMTPGGKYLDDLDLFGRNSPLTQVQAMHVWEYASREFARSASGQVRVVTGVVKPNSVLNRIELPELYVNPNVWGIDVLNLLPRIGIK